jgi:hypothetical protein
VFGLLSFFVSEPDGSNLVTIAYVKATDDYMFGSVPAVTKAELHNIAGAIQQALAQTTTGYYADSYKIPGAPSVTYQIGNPADPADDTITLPSVGAIAWSRAKAAAYVAALAAYVPLPPPAP